MCDTGLLMRTLTSHHTASLLNLFSSGACFSCLKFTTQTYQVMLLFMRCPPVFKWAFATRLRRYMLTTPEPTLILNQPLTQLIPTQLPYCLRRGWLVRASIVSWCATFDKRHYTYNNNWDSDTHSQKLVWNKTEAANIALESRVFIIFFCEFLLVLKHVWKFD